MTQSTSVTTGRRATFSGWGLWVAALAVMAGLLMPAPAAAETRSLKIKFVHTGETAEIVFKRDGRYDRDGLNRLNHLLRDFRRNEPTKMDPRLFDLAWAIYRQSGSRDYIHVLSGYRSPQTNAWLKRTRGGQAEKSQHIQGKAMDFYIPGVSIKRIREIAMKQQGGGVGYYPRSGSPFVHIDVARVRAWPRMSRQELVRLFPDGKTLHLPPDGKPLPGYEAAMAAYTARQKSGDIAIASAASGGKKAGVLAALFGDDTEGEEDVAPAPAARPATVAAAKAPQPAEVAALAPEPASPGGTVREAILAALPERGAPAPLATPRPEADVGGIQDVIGAGEAAPEAPAVAYADVPIPTRRPAYAPSEADVELASLDPAAPVPSARPGAVADDSALAAIVPADAPSAAMPAADTPAITVASVPEKGGKGGRVKNATLASLEPAPLPAATPTRTDKGARPHADDAAPAPRPTVRPVRNDDVETALADPVDEIMPSAGKSRTFAQLAVLKPTAVYMAGFTSDSEKIDIHRFTGKAVEFRSIAKFARAQ